MRIIIFVSLIAIIMAVSVPAYQRQTQVRHARDCAENLARIDAAIWKASTDRNLHNGTSVAIDSLVSTSTGYLARLPQCPGGGTYPTEISVGETPTCTLAHQGHRWPNLAR